MEESVAVEDDTTVGEDGDYSLSYLPLGVVTASENMEDWTTPRSSYSSFSQQVDSADDHHEPFMPSGVPCSCSAPSSPATAPSQPQTLPPRHRGSSWPLPPPEQERLLDSSDQRTPDDSIAPPSPVHGVWLTEPTSIDEPLLLLDEDEAEASAAATVARLRAELAEARSSSKADRAQLEALSANVEDGEREREALLAECQRLKQESNALTEQLQNHHGIMAADWAQTLGFQERLRHAEVDRDRLAAEVGGLREGIAARAEEMTSLRQDAANWRLLCRTDSLQAVSANELDVVLEACLPGISRLHAEMHNRSRAVQLQLTQELEGRLCVVCKDKEKAILFKPCLHVCVCEGCRGRLRPYRCPICQEPVREHVGRVHF